MSQCHELILRYSFCFSTVYSLGTTYFENTVLVLSAFDFPSPYLASLIAALSRVLISKRLVAISSWCEL
jgi:hypothetical protein